MISAFALTLSACGGGSDEDEILNTGSSTTNSSGSSDDNNSSTTTTYVATIYASDNALLASVLAGLIDGVDLDSDGNALITQNAIDATTKLYISDKGLSSLLGIEHFVNLTTLDFNNNTITSVDLSTFTALTYLDCSYNQMTSLELDDLAKLVVLDCSYNQLSQLDISMLENLASLTCGSQSSGIITLIISDGQESLTNESDVTFQVTTSGTNVPNYEHQGKF